MGGKMHFQLLKKRYSNLNGCNFYHSQRILKK
jgi:hypothetical protein